MSHATKIACLVLAHKVQQDILSQEAQARIDTLDLYLQHEKLTQVEHFITCLGCGTNPPLHTATEERIRPQFESQGHTIAQPSSCAPCPFRTVSNTDWEIRLFARELAKLKQDYHQVVICSSRYHARRVRWSQRLAWRDAGLDHVPVQFIWAADYKLGRCRSSVFEPLAIANYAIHYMLSGGTSLNAKPFDPILTH